MCIPMIGQKEKAAIALEFAQDQQSMALQQYRDERQFMLEVKAIAFPYGPELMRAIKARKEWSEACKRVKELEKEVCK